MASVVRIMGTIDLVVKLFNDVDPKEVLELIQRVRCDDPFVLDALAVQPDGGILYPAMMHNALTPAPVDLRRRWMRDMCLGLAALHRHDLVHGGVHPWNVLVRHTGRAVISDVGHNTLRTRTKRQVALVASDVEALRYMAPEHITQATTTTGSDIFSAASTILHVLDGVVPFATRSAPFDIVKGIVDGDVPGTSCDAALQTVLTHCWKPRSECRLGAKRIAVLMESIFGLE